MRCPFLLIGLLIGLQNPVRCLRRPGYRIGYQIEYRTEMLRIGNPLLRLTGIPLVNLTDTLKPTRAANPIAILTATHSVTHSVTHSAYWYSILTGSLRNPACSRCYPTAA